ncbi:MAG: Ig-like domain-containing protein [Planctomycetota bacterium]
MISADGGAARNPGGRTADKGIRGTDLIGTSFTVTQIPDLDPNAPAATRTNQVTYTFGQNIPLSETARLPDIMRAIADGINAEGSLQNNDSVDAPGPIAGVRATALGGAAGDNPGINNLIRQGIENNPRIFFPHRDGIVNPATYEFNTQIGPGGDQLGFGHNQRGTPENGTTEQYVFLENIAKIELSPEAIAAGLTLDPVAGSDTDQIINETGILVGTGASPAILNNVFVNLHESVVVAESRAAGFGTNSPNVQNKVQEVVVVGSVFQYDETQPHLHQSKFSESVGLTTNAAVGPSNVNGGTDDFNVVTPDDADTLVNPTGDNFLPAPFSPAIDSNIDSLIERSEFANLKQSVGIPISNVLAPLRDVTNVLRVDNPLFSNTGQGSSVFGDRGSEELADFVGPVAISEAPRDDDARGLDTDPNTSFINLTEGVFEEFRIQLRDAGDASDPFTGSGIDNNTVVVAEIPGVRREGANVTLFEDERLLVEGIDYTFNFDETKHIITLTPLAGIWDNDRAYRIQLNNTDRTVVIAPSAAEVSDGEQVTITDSNGGQVVFEFESGFQIQMPEPITLEVPTVGTNQGGLSDGGVFSINDGVNPVAVFEFDSDGTTVANPVALPTDPTPVDEEELEAFLTTIANNIAAAIQAVVDDPAQTLDVDVRVVGTSVVVGAEQGSRADVSTSGLIAASRTIGLQVPSSGAGIGGVAVGDSFQINDGSNNEQFQFVDVNTPAAPGAVPIDITPPLGVGNEPLNTAEVATAIQAAIQQSALNLNPLIVGQVVYLNLPDTGLVNVPAGQLRPVSVSRVPTDGEQIVFTPNDETDQVVFELNRTDERQADGSILDDGVDANNIPIDLTRLTTGEELAGLVANAIRIPTIAGLSPNEISVVPGALLTVGGEAGLGLAVSGSSLQVIGSPDVTGPSTLEIFGPLLLRVPFGTPDDGDFITVFDDVGTPINLEFDDDGVLNDPNAGRIGFTRFDDVDTLSAAVVGAINNSGAGITASYLGGGQISLGRIQNDRIDTTNSELTTQRGVVSDGEILTIRQGNLSVSYEFESVNNGGGITTGNVAVPFQPGSSTLEVANSLAAAITNNNGGLNLSASVNADGQVALQDLPGTLVDVTQAPTLILTGVPGGAIPVRISPAFSDAEVKQALLRAINSVNTGPAGNVTTLQAEDRGGATLFVENGLIFEGPVTTFFLPAIRDIQGQPLRANREDSTTQFTILMPTAGLDFGDAADPVGGVPGRYPTALENDGARHVVGTDLFLGSQVDADPSGLASAGADGDDSVTDVSSTGALFSVAIVGGNASVNVQSELVDPATRDGDTVTIDTGITTATLEFDLDGRFDEDNYAIQPADLTVESILAAMITALEESPVRPAGVNIVGTSLQISGDDEDGVSFISPENPSGVLNPNTVLPITVSVTGGGVLQGWIDYDADGDWEDEEQILFFEPGADPTTATPRDEVIFSDIGGVQTFTLDTYFPDSSPDPLFVTNTTARFRVSRVGDLSPTGLALSGEVEDYQLLLVPGSPPTLTPDQSARTFTVDEDRVLQALDGSGVLTAPTGDDGLLAGVVDPEGDAVAIFPDDTGVRQLFTNGGVFAGELNLSSDGTFTFSPAMDFVGSVSFTARVTDQKPQDPSSQLVNADPINVTIDVLPVNDPPVATSIDVVVSRTIDEDQVILFTAEELIDPFYSPGPANEANQLLVFRSVSSPNGDDSLSLRGGTLEIQPDGRSVRYTPPVDFNGADPDVFNFIVADVPGGNQISEAAAKPGTVSLTINPVNDAPIVGNDSFNATEDQILRIPIRGMNGSIGILDNDTPGPQNEIDPPESQTIDLAPGQFPVQTPRGGRVDLEGDELVYRPPPLYSGPDNFTYRVVDNLGAESTGVVSLEVGGENNAPLFVGVNGDPNTTSLTFEESKPNAQSDQFDLNTWFSDPENDVLQFAVNSSNSAIVEAELDGSTLTLTRPAFAFGTVQLTVTATDPMGLFVEQNIPITINNDNDSPIVIGSLDPLSGIEDQTVVSELANVFRDPDGDALTYVVARLGTVLRPTAQQIIDHPLVQSINFVGDQMQIVPEPDQSGSVDIELEATDGSFLVNDFFTLTIAPVPDAPVSVADGYNVAIGSTLRVLNPAEGLLRNDSDADGDAITVDLASVTQPQLGSLTVNEDGTFVYVNTSGTVGQTDSFQYRAIDTTTRTSQLTTVTLELTRSQYQNPIQGQEADVTADGVVSPIDALRVINFLSRQATPGAVPVSEIGAPPPDFLDVNGDGFVSAADALAVINQLALNANGGGEGEQITSLSSTTAFAAASSDFLPTSNVFAVTSEPEGEQAVDTLLDTTDSLLTAGLSIDSVASDTATDQLVDSVFDSSSETSIDNALTDWESELDTSLND